MLKPIGTASGLSVLALAFSTLQSVPANAATVVHGALGGTIYGYDVDHNGSEGILAEAASHGGGKVDIAIETFDQKTGKIIKVLKQISDTTDGFVTLGVQGKGVALFEREHSKKHSFEVSKATFQIANPLSKNKLSGPWTPPLESKSYAPLDAVSGDQGSAATAFMVEAEDDAEQYSHYVFSSDVAANTFGPVIELTHLRYPVMAFDNATNIAVIASSDGCVQCQVKVVLANLVTGKITHLKGLGFGSPQGIAVDAADGIACTTTADGYVEFYDLAHHTAREVSMPNHHGTFWSGSTISFDPVNKLFLIVQQNSSTAPSGSSLQLYDPTGHLVESVNGLHSDAYQTIDHIAFNPKTRTAFVLNGDNTKELETFHY
jgi:WD40 repeat protein